MQTFLSRSDVSIGLREFFADRGIFPAEIPNIIVPDDEPLIEAASVEVVEADDDGDDLREGTVEKLAQMGFVERLQGIKLRD